MPNLPEVPQSEQEVFQTLTSSLDFSNPPLFCNSPVMPWKQLTIFLPSQKPPKFGGHPSPSSLDSGGAEDVPCEFPTRSPSVQ